MANLSSTGGTHGASTSQVNEVQISDNQFFANVDYLLAHEMHHEEQLDSDVDSVIDDNTIPYHQYQIDTQRKRWDILSTTHPRTKFLLPRMLSSLRTLAGEDDQEIDEPQSDINPIHRSTRTKRAPDRMCLYIDAEEHELGDLGKPANYKAALLDPESENG
ncbi:hypothetical protein Tco_0630603 [Tanacetum coccineum]